MRSTTRVLAGLGVAGVVAAGGSAMTANNTGLIAHEAGYQQVAVSGVQIKNTAYNQNSTDPSKVDSIVFTLADGENDVPDSSHLQVLTIYRGATAMTTPSGTNTYQYGDADTGSTQECVFASPTITCDTTVGPQLLLSEVHGISLAVTPHTIVDATPSPDANPA